jgi:hypothetical protein
LPRELDNGFAVTLGEAAVHPAMHGNKAELAEGFIFETEDARAEKQVSTTDLT